MQPHPQIKIEQIEPNIKDFQLHFEISEVTSRNNDKIQCRVVDDTGIVDAYFDRFGNKLEKGGVYLMTHLNCAIVDNRLRVEMSKDTVVSKEPDIIGFKDKTNDISKKTFSSNNSDSKIKQPQVTHKVAENKKKEVIPQNTKKVDVLIPFTKQEALQQLRQQKQFEEQLKAVFLYTMKNKDSKDTKNNEHKQPTKQTNKPHQDQKHYKQKQLQYKQKQVQKQKGKEKQKEKQKISDKKQHKYQEKKVKQNNNHNNNDNKNLYKLKQQQKQQNQNKGRHYKQKQILYKQKNEEKGNNFRKNSIKNKKYDDRQKQSPNKPKKNQNKANENKKNQVKKSNQQKKQKNTKIQQKKVEKIEQITPKKAPASQSQDKNSNKNHQIKKTPEKKGKECANVASIMEQVGNFVNLRVWVTEKTQKNNGTNNTQFLIADSSGSVWLQITKMNLQGKVAYQIDNLQVCKDENRVYLKQSDISEDRRLEEAVCFNLKQINAKQ